MFVVSFVACFVDIVHQPKGPFVVSIVVIFVDVTSEISMKFTIKLTTKFAGGFHQELLSL